MKSENLSLQIKNLNRKIDEIKTIFPALQKLAKGMRLIKQNKKTDDYCGNGFA